MPRRAIHAALWALIMVAWTSRGNRQCQEHLHPKRPPGAPPERLTAYPHCYRIRGPSDLSQQLGLVFEWELDREKGAP